MSLELLCSKKIPQLIEFLYLDFPRSAPLVGKLVQIQRSGGGLLSGHVYVDSYPKPSIVLMENLKYKRKDEVEGNPVLLYSTCDQAKLQDYITSDKLLSSITTRKLSEFQDATYSCVEVIKSLAEQHFLHIEMLACPYIYWLPSSVEIMSSCCPEDYYISSLSHHHAGFINEKWKFGSPHLFKRIEAWLKYSFTAAVFCYRTNEPVSWGMVAEAGCIAGLHTLEGHRRKGLAQIVIRELVLKLRGANMWPFVYIEEENFISQNLFVKMGFQKCVDGQVAFFTLER